MTTDWVKIGNAYFRPSEITMVATMPDGSLAMAIPGGQIVVPLTDRSRILALLGIVDVDSRAGTLPATSGPPHPPTHNAEADSRVSCGICGNMLPAAVEAARTDRADIPERWVCKCSPS